MIERKLAIAQICAHTAQRIAQELKELPKAGKKRNIFRKGYDRRPRNKSKRAYVFAKAAFSAMTGAMQIRAQLATPLPRYKNAEQ